MKESIVHKYNDGICHLTLDHVQKKISYLYIEYACSNVLREPSSLECELECSDLNLLLAQWEEYKNRDIFARKYRVLNHQINKEIDSNYSHLQIVH